MSQPIIQLDNVTKTFKVPLKGQGVIKSLFVRKHKPVDVIKDISFQINEGEFIGYIGPNGAGKSTTIKLLTGILYPSSGDVKVLGYNPYEDRYKYTYNIGVVFGQRSLLEFDIPVIDSFLLYKAIYEIDEDKYQARLDRFAKALDLKELFHIPVRKLSLGQRMRCEIAASLLHEPRVIFLDEPTIGLDALAKQEIRHFLKEVNTQEQVTIMLTTHDMDDIETLCERIIFINKGAIIYDGRLDKLKQQYATGKDIEISFKEQINIPEQLSPLLKEVNEKTLTYTFAVSYSDAVKILPKLLALGSATDVSIHEPNLEEVVKLIYQYGYNE